METEAIKRKTPTFVLFRFATFIQRKTVFIQEGSSSIRRSSSSNSIALRALVELFYTSKDHEARSSERKTNDTQEDGAGGQSETRKGKTLGEKKRTPVFFSQETHKSFKQNSVAGV